MTALLRHDLCRDIVREVVHKGPSFLFFCGSDPSFRCEITCIRLLMVPFGFLCLQSPYAHVFPW